MPTFDPVASFEITAVEAHLAGRLLRIPPIPASGWLEHLMRTSDALGLLALVENDPTDELFEENLASAQDVRTSLEGMLEVAAGCSPWTAFCLAGVAREHWQYVGGELVRCNVALAQIPLGGALVAIYTTVVRRLDEKSLQQFDVAISAPPITGIQKPRKDLPPLPANALQYVQTRPKTVLRRPQDRPGAQSGEPTPLPEQRAGNDRPANDVHVGTGDVVGADGGSLPVG